MERNQIPYKLAREKIELSANAGNSNKSINYFINKLNIEIIENSAVLYHTLVHKNMTDKELIEELERVPTV